MEVRGTGRDQEGQALRLESRHSVHPWARSSSLWPRISSLAKWRRGDLFDRSHCKN